MVGFALSGVEVGAGNFPAWVLFRRFGILAAADIGARGEQLGGLGGVAVTAPDTGATGWVDILAAVATVEVTVQIIIVVIAGAIADVIQDTRTQDEVDLSIKFQALGVGGDAAVAAIPFACLSVVARLADTITRLNNIAVAECEWRK